MKIMIFEFLRSIRHDNWFVRSAQKLSLIAFVTSVILLLWRFSTLPPLIPLWYNKPWGADRLAHPLWLALLPLGNFLILIINAIAGRTLPHDMLMFNQVLAATAFLVAILSLVSLTKILFLVS